MALVKMRLSRKGEVYEEEIDLPGGSSVGVLNEAKRVIDERNKKLKGDNRLVLLAIVPVQTLARPDKPAHRRYSTTT